MKTLFLRLSSSLLLAASCGDSTKVDGLLYVDPVPEPDRSCIGVAGFQVVVSSQGRDSASEPLVGPTPIFDTKSCALSGSYTVGDLDVGAPVTVAVTGYDSSGAARVGGTTTLTKLQTEPSRITLHGISPTLPLLVVARNQWLGGAPLSSVTGVVVATAKMQPMELVSANRMDAGRYFDPEPAAFGVPVGLAADGTDTGLAITVELLGPATQIRQKATAVWDPTHFYYEAK
jgi:hypothetical protein